MIVSVPVNRWDDRSPFLYNYEIKTGDILDDEMATILLRRLLDSAVFTAFDENLMFIRTV